MDDDYIERYSRQLVLKEIGGPGQNLLSKARIAIIGAGNLGKSIAKGLITTNAITTLYLTRRNVDSIKDFEGYKNIVLTSDNAEAVKNSDILIFASVICLSLVKLVCRDASVKSSKAICASIFACVPAFAPV